MPLQIRSSGKIRQIDEMLKFDTIEPSNSHWNSPVLMVKKKSCEWKVAIDYHHLNSVTWPISIPIPKLQDIVDSLGEAEDSASPNMASDFCQIPLHKAPQQKAAFLCHSGVYSFKCLSCGLMNAPMPYQQTMQCVLGDLLGKNLDIYIDDLLISSTTFEEHLMHL